MRLGDVPAIGELPVQQKLEALVRGQLALMALDEARNEQLEQLTDRVADLEARVFEGEAL